MMRTEGRREKDGEIKDSRRRGSSKVRVWPKSEVKKTFTYLLNGFSVHCLCHSYLCLNGFTFLIIVYSIIVYIICLF